MILIDLLYILYIKMYCIVRMSMKIVVEHALPESCSESTCSNPLLRPNHASVCALTSLSKQLALSPFFLTQILSNCPNYRKQMVLSVFSGVLFSVMSLLPCYSDLVWFMVSLTVRVSGFKKGLWMICHVVKEAERHLVAPIHRICC